MPSVLTQPLSHALRSVLVDPAVSGLVSGGAMFDPAAVLDASPSAGRFRWNGQSFTDEAAFLTAIGAVKSGQAFTFGPILPAGAPELITNWDFSAGVTGWTAGQIAGGAATIEAAAGELTLTANTTTSAQVLQQVATALGAAYRLEVRSKRGTAQNGRAPGGIGFTGGNTAGITKGNNNTVYANDVRYLPSLSAASMSFGGRIFGNADDLGTGLYDSISLKQVVPFIGYENGGFAFIIKGHTPPSAPGATVVLFQADGDYISGATETDQTALNRVRVSYDTGSGKHLRMSMAFSGTDVVAFDMGLLEFDTAFEIVVSVLPNRVFAGLIGGAFFLDTATNSGIAGIAAMRLGRSRAGEQWTGTIERARLFANAFTDVEFYRRALTDTAIAAWGDSLTAGAGSTGGLTYPAQAAAAFTPARTIINLGIGGQTSTQIAARMNAQPILVTVTGNQIPASGGVAVTAKNINVLFNSGTFSGTQTGALAGVPGTMSTDASGNWTFTRTKAGEAVAFPAGSQFTCDLGEALKPRETWLWLGRNGPQAGYTVEGDIAAAVASLGHDRYLVAGSTTGSGDSAGSVTNTLNRNAALLATYGPRYVDVLGALLAANDGSAGDLEDFAANIVPRSLRSAQVHLLNAGYAVVAAAFKARHEAMGW